MTLKMNPEVFKYQSLAEADSFRLLLLQPSPSHDSDLQCHVLHATLSQCDRDIIDQYTALSYVWGDPSNTGSIYVDGSRVIITATLDAALRDLRDESRVIRIWADALCIDQSNLTERAAQVSLMDQIYSIAHHTVIHLGPLTPAAETILKAAPSNTSGVIHESHDIVKIAQENMLQAVWFTRVWVFQELVLSRDPWVQCGNLRARWADICNMLISPSWKQSSKELQVLADMNSSRGSTRLQFLTLLTSRRGLGATDARDMIYANMGIAFDLHSLLDYVQVDYRKTCEELYESVARYLMENIGPEGPTIFFPHAASNDQSKQKGLASWAPDWSLPASNLVEMYKDNNLRKLQLDSKAHYAFIGHPLTLAWVGYKIDVVESFSVELPNAEALDVGAREEYQKAMKTLMGMYLNVWWSGDDSGQHQHVDLRGKEEEHEKLCRVLGGEWLRIMGEELSASQIFSQEDLENQKKFEEGFRTWLEARAPQHIIMAGSGSEGMASLMYAYLQPRNIPSALTGRRLATTRNGRVAVVPRNVQMGDKIVHLAGPLISLVFRRDSRPREENLETDIKNALRAIDEDYKNQTDHRLDEMEKVDEMEVEYCTLVGECYVDGEVGWKLNQEWDLKIYALR
ncbi:heterokaryon incompatibility protein-domain-containing protein [Rhexocercosporidium sp. MPI-PUGE-AT-0058]|nr:heterokaryon incompatibility protein-domain-containing protein [Rhexocercosporidium sp. MPI-PUGE-AT-0058]